MNAPRIPPASIAASTQVRGVIVERSERAAAIATIVDHHGHHPTDEMLFSRVFRRFGWEMFTDEALAMLADAYEVQASTRERMDAENRAIAAGRRA